MLQQLLSWARRRRKLVILAWDNANTHKAKMIQAFMNRPGVRRWIQPFWISRYSPDLNDIERLWKHLKQTGMANHLFKNRRQFADHLRRLLNAVNRDQAAIPISFQVQAAA